MYIPLVRLFSYKLFTPGPLSTTLSVKQAMAHDEGYSKEFFQTVSSINKDILQISNQSPEKYTSILLPGSGTFGVEATLRTAVSTSNKILIAANGAYGERMIKMCSILNIPHKVLRYDEREKVKTADVLSSLTEDITHFAMVHSETTTGILNPIYEISKEVKKRYKNITIIGDCVSSFGAVNENFEFLDFIVTCSNKLLQGVPGLAIIVANKEKLKECKGNARSAMLDLNRISESQDHFVCLPPFQSVLGLKQAISEFFQEGGVVAREKRYQHNQRYLKEHMEKLGFRLYIRPEDQGWIISTFIEPSHKNYNFQVFYNYLVNRKIVIYPGKLSKLPTFRIGTIGELHEKDMEECVEKIKDAFHEMKINLPLDQ